MHKHFLGIRVPFRQFFTHFSLNDNVYKYFISCIFYNVRSNGQKSSISRAKIIRRETERNGMNVEYISILQIIHSNLIALDTNISHCILKISWYFLCAFFCWVLIMNSSLMIKWTGQPLSYSLTAFDTKLILCHEKRLIHWWQPFSLFVSFFSTRVKLVFVWC